MPSRQKLLPRLLLLLLLLFVLLLRRQLPPPLLSLPQPVDYVGSYFQKNGIDALPPETGTKDCAGSLNLGAFIIRIGLWYIVLYLQTRNPQNSIGNYCKGPSSTQKQKLHCWEPGSLSSCRSSCDREVPSQETSMAAVYSIVPPSKAWYSIVYMYILYYIILCYFILYYIYIYIYTVLYRIIRYLGVFGASGSGRRKS